MIKRDDTMNASLQGTPQHFSEAPLQKAILTLSAGPMLASDPNKSFAKHDSVDLISHSSNSSTIYLCVSEWKARSAEFTYSSTGLLDPWITLLSHFTFSAAIFNSLHIVTHTHQIRRTDRWWWWGGEAGYCKQPNPTHRHHFDDDDDGN